MAAKKYRNVKPGMVFGVLTTENKVGGVWRCRCQCGALVGRNAGDLVRGLCIDGCRKCSPNMRRHGKSRSPEWQTWAHIKSRCYNPNTPGYEYWGGRGITVCDRWRNSFEAFLEDMGPRPEGKFSLDRIDNDGPYSPENCRWVDYSTQMRNKRSNRYLTLNGTTMLAVDWAKHLGMDYPTLRQRLHKGWSTERALTEPVVPSPHRSVLRKRAA